MNDPVAYINVEERKLEWATPMGWNTPTVVKMDKLPLYTTPPKKEWVGLMDEEIKAAWSQLWYDLNNGKLAAADDPSRHTTVMFARAIEAKLKEKNNG